MTTPRTTGRVPLLIRVGITVLVAVAVVTAVLVANRAPEPADLTSLDVVTLERDPQALLPHPLSVPVADRGCPAYAVDAPVPPDDGVSGQDVWLSLDVETGTALVLSCLGAVEETGALGEIVGAVPDEASGSTRYGTRVWVRSPFGEALRTETHFTSTGTTLTEWFTERDGHLVGVGLLHDTDEPSEVATVEAMLTTWRWS